MKHIKLFEQKKNITEIEETSNLYGAYLKDHGCNLHVEPFSNYYKLVIVVDDSKFDDIKEELMYFIDMLSTKYEMVGRKFISIKKGKAIFLTKEELLNYNLNSNGYTKTFITIYISPK